MVSNNWEKFVDLDHNELFCDCGSRLSLVLQGYGQPLGDIANITEDDIYIHLSFVLSPPVGQPSLYFCNR